MRVYKWARIGALSLAACLSTAATAPAAIIINEFVYDDNSTDNREFVELYNNGVATENIGGWVVTGRDATTVNGSATITAGTMLAPGGYYVLSNTGVLNSNQTFALDFLENGGADSLELRDTTGALIDAVLYETNIGVTGNVAGNGLPAEVGPGIFGNGGGFTPDLGVAGSFNTTASTGRFVNGRDTNNNGRDFGVRPSTPGTSNNTGLMTFYSPPDPTGSVVGSPVAGLTGSFVAARYMDPTVADVTNNPNVIPPAPSSGNRAITVFDSSGGGDGATSNQVFGTTQGAFKILAYLDTSDQPQNFNATNVNFTGAEITVYGIGGGDMLTNLTDLAGNIGINPVALPAAETANGYTGINWVYERTAISGAIGATQTLYLVDANDGGDSDVGGNTALDWSILQTIDISGLASNWFELGISIDAAGNGVATFNGTDYAFVTSTNLHSGAFNVGYRENLQLGADGTPDAIMRPATFTIVPIPEPATFALAALSACGLIVAARRRRSIA
jgi:hypothetical protein